MRDTPKAIAHAKSIVFKMKRDRSEVDDKSPVWSGTEASARVMTDWIDDRDGTDHTSYALNYRRDSYIAESMVLDTLWNYVTVFPGESVVKVDGIWRAGK